MEITLKRCKSTFDKDYVIGHIFVDQKYICDSLEDKWRNLSDDMSEKEVKKIKAKGQTCIPRGRYKITLNVISPKFYQKAYYKAFCGGKLPRLIDVKGYSGVLVHCGNDASHTEGCVLCGFNRIKGRLVDSKTAFERLYTKMKRAQKDNEEIWIDIQE